MSQNAFAMYLQLHHLRVQPLFPLAILTSTDRRGRGGQGDMRRGQHENTPWSRKIIKADWGGLAQTQTESTGGKTGDQHATINWNYLHIVPLSSWGIQLFSKCHPGLQSICPTRELLVLAPDCLHYAPIINCILVIISNENQAWIFLSQPLTHEGPIGSHIVCPISDEHSFFTPKNWRLSIPPSTQWSLLPPVKASKKRIRLRNTILSFF